MASNDEFREALLLAEEFIQSELNARESGFSPDEYIQEARDVLAIIQKALAE
jgi:hypothetical protein